MLKLHLLYIAQVLTTKLYNQQNKVKAILVCSQSETGAKKKPKATSLSQVRVFTLLGCPNRYEALLVTNCKLITLLILPLQYFSTERISSFAHCPFWDTTCTPRCQQCRKNRPQSPYGETWLCLTAKQRIIVLRVIAKCLFSNACSFKSSLITVLL